MSPDLKIEVWCPLNHPRQDNYFSLCCSNIFLVKFQNSDLFEVPKSLCSTFPIMKTQIFRNGWLKKYKISPPSNFDFITRAECRNSVGKNGGKILSCLEKFLNTYTNGFPFSYRILNLKAIFIGSFHCAIAQPRNKFRHYLKVTSLLNG